MLENKTDRKNKIKLFSKALLICLVFISVFLVKTIVLAAPPPAKILLSATIADDNVLLEGKRQIVVKLFSGNQVTTWQELHKSIDFQQGVCTLNLGSITPFTTDNFDILTPNFRLLVDGQELEIPVGSVPYAFRAAYAEEIPQDMNFSLLTVSKNILLGSQINLTSKINDPSYTVLGQKISSLDSTLLVLGDTFIEENLAVSTNFIVLGNKVGIRTLTPQYDLDVQGTINANALYIGGTVYSSKEGDEKISAIMQLATENGNLILADGDTWTTITSPNFKKYMALSPSDDVYFNKLGIDTTDIAGIVHIRSSDNIITNYSPVPYKADTLVVTNNRVGIGFSLPIANLHVLGKNPLMVGTINSPNALVVGPSGNVGIQTGTPDTDFALHIIGNMKVEGSIDTAAGLNTDSDWSIKSGVVYNNLPDIKIGIGTDSPSGNLHVKSLGRTDYLGDTLVITGNRIGIGTKVPTGMVHIKYNGPEGDHQLFIIQKEDESVFVARQSGNIGLGTSNPSNLLHIQKDGNAVFVVTVNAVGVGTSEPQALLDLNVSSDAVANLLTISNEGVKKFIINKLGQVAIGTENPQGIFHITSSGKNLLLATENGVAIGAIQPIAKLDVNEPGIPTQPLFVVRTETKPHLFISQSGLVGVNTANPQGVFHIQSESPLQPGILKDTFVVTGNRIGIGTANPVARLEIVDDFPLLVRSANTPNILVVSPLGNIGIGTANPTEALVISGNLRISGGILSDQEGFVQFPLPQDAWVQNQWSGVIYQTSGQGTGYPFNQSGHVILQSRSNEAKDIIFAVGATQPAAKLVIKNNGLIGIGTTVPSGSLHIVNADEQVLIVTSNRVGIGTLTPKGQFEIGDTLFLVTNNAITVGTTDPLNYKFRINGSLLVDGGIFQGLGDAADISDSDWDYDKSKKVVYNLFDQVGIGTETPLGDFHIVSTQDGTIRRDIILVDNGNLAIGTKNVLGYFHVDSPDLPNNIVVTHDGYIGIGTSDPQYNVDVVGTLNASGLFVNNVSLTAFGNPANGVIVVSTGNEWLVQGIDEGREAIALGARQDLIVTGNKVGIHMLQPLADLHVSGNNNNIFIAQSTGASGTGNIILDSFGNVGIGTLVPEGRFHVVNQIGLSFETSLLVTGNRIGIGTNIPSDLLHLQFNGSNYDTYLGIKLKNESPGSVTYIPKTGLDLVLTGDERATILAVVQDKTNYVNGWNNPTTLVDLEFLTSDSTRLIIKDNGDIGIGTKEPSGNLHIISGSQTTIVVTNNRVGIGTTEPEGILHIPDALIVKDDKVGVGIVNPQFSLTATPNVNFGNNMFVVTENGVYIGPRYQDPKDPGNFVLYVEGSVKIDGVVASTGGADGDWIVATGSYLKAAEDYVGIGPATPAGPFHISSGIEQFILIATQNKIGIGLNSPDTSLEIRTTADYAPFKVSGPLPSEDIYMVVSQNGNIGIHTADPQYTLEIDGILNVKDKILMEGYEVATKTESLKALGRLSTANNNIIYADGDTWKTASKYNARAILGLGLADTPTLNKLGLRRLTIPQADLHIGQNDTFYVDVYGDQYGGEVAIGTNTPQGQFHVKSRLPNGTNVNDALVVTGNNVGINTISPTYDLTVVGDAYTEKIYLNNLYNNAQTHLAPFISLGSKQGIRSDRANLIDDGNIAFYTQITGASVGSSEGEVLIFSGGKWEASDKNDLLNQIDLGPDTDAKFKRVGINLKDRPGYGLDQSVKGELEVFSEGREALIVTRNRIGLGMLFPESTLHILPSENISALRITSSNPTQVLMVVSRNGYVGIAKEDPAYTLDVNGVINSTEIRFNGDLVATQTPGLLDLAQLTRDYGNMIYSNGVNWLVARNNNARHVLGLGTQDSPGFTRLGLGGITAPMGTIHIEANTFIVTENKVGIYTLLPSANLHVSANAGDIPFMVSVPAQQYSILVSADGKVGIASANPNYDLDVGGAINADSIYIKGEPVASTTEGLNGLAVLPTDNGNFIVGDGSDWSTASGNDARIYLGLGKGDSPTFNQIGLGASFVGVPLADLHVGIQALAVTKERVGIGTLLPSGDLHIISAFGHTLVVTNNMVGIRTKNPSSALEVSGNISLANNYLINTKGVWLSDYQSGLAGDTNRHEIIALNEAIQVPSGGVVIGTFAGSNWTVTSGDMLISKSLGIGVTNAEATLHVTKDFKVSVGSSSDAFVVKDFGDDFVVSIDGKLYVEGLSIRGSGVAGHTDELADIADLKANKGNFIYGNGSPEMWIVVSANVVRDVMGLGENDRPTFSALGINILSPVGDLQIGLDTFFVTANAIGIGTIAPKGRLHIVTNGTDSLVVTKDSLGIGVLNPGASLNVKTNMQDYVAKFENTANNTDGKGLFISGGTNAAGQYQAITFDDGDANAPIYLGYANGRLGIGTTDPGAVLQVDSPDNAILILNNNLNSSAALKIANNQNSFYLGVNQEEGFSISTATDLGSSAILTATDNMVGIGTTMPVGYVHVKDSNGTIIIATNNS
ncbi:hypothetical protein ACFLZV_03165, partial [Candidatus Margulisiibacteriota bacterium]